MILDFVEAISLPLIPCPDHSHPQSLHEVSFVSVQAQHLVFVAYRTGCRPFRIHHRPLGPFAAEQPPPILTRLLYLCKTSARPDVGLFGPPTTIGISFKLLLQIAKDRSADD